MKLATFRRFSRIRNTSRKVSFRTLRVVILNAIAYRLILGRKAESFSALVTSDTGSIESLGLKFLGSYESRIRNRAILTPKILEQDLKKSTNSEFDEHLQQVIHQWNSLGEMDPYWGILSSENFRGVIDSETKDYFFQTGQESIDRLLEVCAVNGIHLDSNSKVLELGCGLGRLTQTLSALYQSVTAIDISKSNLVIARINLADRDNIEYISMTGINDIEKLSSDYNLIVSLITFQHNPPEVQLLLFEKLLEKLSARNGVGYFQFVTHITERGLENSRFFGNGSFDTFALPMAAILKTIHLKGFKLFECYRDDFQLDPDFHSYSFFIIN